MFFKETALQETAIGSIPKDWTVKYVSELFQVETGTTPSTAKKEDYWEKGTVNWLTPADMSKSNGAAYISSGERRITEKAVRDYNLTVMPKGSLILSTRAPVGYVAVLSEQSAFNQGCKGLIARESEDVCSEFYYYYLLSKKQILNNLSSGSTFKELSKEMLEKVRVVFLKPREQKGIVEVLSCVDLAIQKTDVVIAKTERLKKGLMQQLLTEGIGHKEFKDTKIGKIPKTWELLRLNDASLSITDGSHFSPKHQEKGFPLATVANMRENYIDIDSCYRISKEDYESLIRSGDKPETNDVLFSKDGTVGLCIVFSQKDHIVVLSSIAIIRPDTSKVDPFFLKYLLQSQFVLRRIVSSKTGAAIKRIILRDLCAVKIPVPLELVEQQKIASILKTVDRKLELGRREKASLERVKLGLMDMLLTGRVRGGVD